MNKLTGQQRLDTAEQFLLRVEAVVDLASVLGSSEYESPSGQLDEVLDDIWAGDRRQHPSMHKLFDLADRIDGDDKNNDELAYQLVQANFLGYLVQFATPVRRSATEHGCSFSWGHCFLNWFYAETIDEAWELAQSWSLQEKQAAIAKQEELNKQQERS